MEKEQSKLSKARNEVKKKRMGMVKQYCWMYAPNVEKSVLAGMRKEIAELKVKIEDAMTNYAKKLAQKES